MDFPYTANRTFLDRLFVGCQPFDRARLIVDPIYRLQSVNVVVQISDFIVARMATPFVRRSQSSNQDNLSRNKY